MSKKNRKNNTVAVKEEIKKVNTYKVREFNAVAIILFIVTFGLCAVFGWLDVVDYLVNDSSLNRAEPFVMPIRYTVICAVFTALIIALAAVGMKIRSKLMVVLSAVYQCIFILSFIVLAFFATGGITNQTLYYAAIYALTAVLLPVYGLIWKIGAYFFLIFIPLVIFTAVAVVKTFKKLK